MQTGSGKTHAFLLPLLNKLVPEKTKFKSSSTAPSQELAYQIYTAAELITKHMTGDIRISRYVSGTDKQRQIEKLQQRNHKS